MMRVDHPLSTRSVRKCVCLFDILIGLSFLMMINSMIDVIKMVIFLFYFNFVCFLIQFVCLPFFVCILFVIYLIIEIGIDAIAD